MLPELDIVIVGQKVPQWGNGNNSSRKNQAKTSSCCSLSFLGFFSASAKSTTVSTAAFAAAAVVVVVIEIYRCARQPFFFIFFFSILPFCLFSPAVFCRHALDKQRSSFFPDHMFRFAVAVEHGRCSLWAIAPSLSLSLPCPFLSLRLINFLILDLLFEQATISLAFYHHHHHHQPHFDALYSQKEILDCCRCRRCRRCRRCSSITALALLMLMFFFSAAVAPSIIRLGVWETETAR